MENLDVHCDWQGERDRQRAEEAAQEFEILWQNRHPALRVLSLPEAVRQRLIDLASGVTHPTEIDGSSAAPRQVSPPSASERLRFALLRDGRKPLGVKPLRNTAASTWPLQKPSKARSLWLATATPTQPDTGTGFRLANTLRFQIR